MKYFIYTIIILVTAAVIAGFFIVGSPAKERLRRFDQQRVEHLQFLQSEIVNYWINKERLPESLGVLKDDIRGTAVPVDPQTGADYVYKRKGELSFALCATFASKSLELETGIGQPRPIRPYGYGIQESWQHEAGDTCFERTIDKDFYKPAKR